jgi:hypothetical protein
MREGRQLAEKTNPNIMREGRKLAEQSNANIIIGEYLNFN